MDKDIDTKEKKILAQIDMYKDNFIKSMEDDLNTADGIASLFDIVKYANSNFDEKTPKFVIQYTYDIMLELSKVLGILSKKDEILEEEILDLIERRTQARKDKDYELADKIRIS